MPTCPNGHQSGSDDWCEVCGHRMSGAGAPPGAMPQPPPPPGYGYPGPAGPHATAQAELCPQCRTPREATASFCEECRYNFVTHTATSYTPLAPPSVPGPNLPPAFRTGPPPQQGPPGAPVQGTRHPDSFAYQDSRPSQVNRPAEPLGQEPGPEAGAPEPPPGFPPPGAPPAPGAFRQTEPGPPVAPQQTGGGDDWLLPPPSRTQSPPPPPSPQASHAPPAPPRPHGPSAPHGPQGPAAPQPPQGPYAPHGPMSPPPPHGQQAPSSDQSAPPGHQGPQTGHGGFPPHQDRPHQDPQGGPQYGAGHPPQFPAPPPGPATWTAVVGPDRAYFTAMMQRSGPEAVALNLPAYSPERHVPLTGSQVTIGRRRHSTGEAPDIDLSVPPEDPGVSHQHAVLVQQPDGSWAVVDQNSTNGTTLNGAEDPIQPYVPVPLHDGDQVHVGAWTTLTLRRG
ncbi:FHA domain-containing protein [Streptomyces sp. NPDC047999]|uniref:FHA domain-containing protein n=1 Tax=Streptomyces sp. NPDC047999 TaxID=3365497 RepID=UPI003718496C